MSVENNSKLLLGGFPNYGTFTEAGNSVPSVKSVESTAAKAQTVATLMMDVHSCLLSSERADRIRKSIEAMNPLVTRGTEESKGKIAKLLQDISLIVARIQQGSAQREEFKNLLQPLVQKAVIEGIIPSEKVLAHMN